MWTKNEIQKAQKEAYTWLIKTFKTLLKQEWPEDAEMIVVEIEQTLDAISSYYEDGFFDHSAPKYFWEMVRDLDKWITDIPFYKRKYQMFLRASHPIVQEQIMTHLRR